MKEHKPSLITISNLEKIPSISNVQSDVAVKKILANQTTWIDLPTTLQPHICFAEKNVTTPGSDTSGGSKS